MARMPATREFAKVAAKPWPGASVAVNTLTIIAPTGPAVAVGVLVSPWGWAGVFAALFGFTAWAGVRLEREKVERERVQFEVGEPYVETNGESVTRPDGPPTEFKGRQYIWIPMVNRGPESRFSAQFMLNTDASQVNTIAPHSPVTSKTWVYAAWESTAARQVTTGHDGPERLLLAMSFYLPGPNAFWFCTSATAAWGASGHNYAPPMMAVDGFFEFWLKIINEATQQVVHRYGRVQYSEHGVLEGDSCITWVDPPVADQP